MIVDLAFRVPMRRWQMRLAHELKHAGHRVRLSAGERRASPGFGVKAAIAIERRLFGPKVSHFDEVPMPSGFPRAEDGPPDVTLALDADVACADDVVSPLFEGDVGDRALIAMATSGRTPSVRIRASTATKTSDLVRATLAIEDQPILTRALDQILARVITLIMQGVHRFEHALPASAVELCSTPSNQLEPRTLSHIAKGLAKKVNNRLSGAPRGHIRWRIAYRRVLGPHASNKSGWPGERFTVLADDGCRFFADPMPFETDGRIYVFFEEYPYATRKGVVAFCEIDATGAATKPRTILECPVHLSYPYVLRHHDSIYMLPEMGGSSRIQLFRAEPFPDRWVPDRVLVDNTVASDATPIFHDGRWWLFTTLSSDGGSSWDQLCLFHAPDFLGPWEPHVGNPVLVDAGAARPAGAMWHDGDTLMRVAQDCRTSYGQAVVVCRVDRLDVLGYAQTVVERLGAPAGYSADGTHTFNRVGELEFIDLRS